MSGSSISGSSNTSLCDKGTQTGPVESGPDLFVSSAPSCYPFIETLFKLCDAMEYPIVRWAPDGTSFVIEDQDEFCSSVCLFVSACV